MKTYSKIGLVFIIVIFVLVGFVLWEFPFLLPPFQYLRFMHRDANYYAEVAHACDFILQHRPVTSNDVVRLPGTRTLPFRLKIPGNDPALPKIIRRLNPDFLLVGTNHVSLFIPPEKMGGFGVIWTQDELQTNRWILQADGDGMLKAVYTEVRN